MILPILIYVVLSSSFVSSLNLSSPPSLLPPSQTLIPNRRDAIQTTIKGLTATTAAFITSTTTLTEPANALKESDYTIGPRGIKYLITQTGSPGKSTKPIRGQTIKTSYTLTLNGFEDDFVLGQFTPNRVKIIDTSKTLLGVDEYFEFVVGIGRVIKGWDVSMLDMVQGERRKIILPPELGYGDENVGDGKIPKGSTLYLEVELVELGKMPEMNDVQVKWLEEHPL
mmetsp:Transcript_38506/g.56506  ORF Transcript_38506/g.56506 Transcript_38506/m.56506 type:complete len:226 (+) Transcript_38506:109-786(+)